MGAAPWLPPPCASLSVVSTFHNIRSAQFLCSSKAKMSALSKVEMSVSAPFWEFGGCYFDGHGGDKRRYGGLRSAGSRSQRGCRVTFQLCTNRDISTLAADNAPHLLLLS